jgi:CheY-like chemotaxis protein
MSNVNLIAAEPACDFSDLTADLSTALAALQQELGVTPAGEGDRDLETVLDHLLTWARRLVHADGGSIYLRYRDHLRLVVAHSDLLERGWGGPELRRRLRGLTLRVDSQSIAGHVALTGEAIDVRDVTQPPTDRPWSFCPALDNRTYAYGCILTVPITLASGEVGGVLQLINPTDANGRPVPFAQGARMTASRFAKRAASLITRRPARVTPPPSAPRPAADMVEELVATPAPRAPSIQATSLAVPRAADTSAAAPAAPEATKQIRNILIADDDPGVRDLLARILRDADPTYAVETATNGIEALAAIFWRRPHIVLLDVKMPGMNGLDVLRQVRTFDPALPVILISGLVGEEAMADAVKNGVLAFVPKPFEVKHIRSLVAAVVN